MMMFLFFIAITVFCYLLYALVNPEKF
ncbi:potassium-transporting ATPase subunit F [Fulvivirgaceae bacterium PWU5]|uniref:Potassium-transporting ATPase subunit F n=1 Tax=Dawidia cretensis TaxID=2782350 RepID=A0AAP2E1L6_9BACT|nr:potassium-transporting ATPase subunit F [Dawidia cretensis]